MSTVDPKAFYAEKGLKRTTLTLHPDTIETLGVTARGFTKQIKTTSQGEIIDVMTSLYISNPQFKAIVDQGIKEHLDKKEIKKLGRPVSTLEGKLRKLSDEERAKIEAML